MSKTITLITGANKGIGYATATALGLAGQTILVGARNATRGQDATSKLQTLGIDAHWIQIDVTDSASINAAVAQVNDQFGHLDILINNAGIALDAHRNLVDLPIDDIRRDFDVNFFGTISVIKGFVPLLQKAVKPQIINVSSEMGSMGLISDPESKFYRVHSVGYQSSKAALNATTITLAKELAPIRVNAANPGFTATDFGGGNDIGQPASAGAAPIVALAKDVDGTATGTFTGNGGPLPW